MALRARLPWLAFAWLGATLGAGGCEKGEPPPPLAAERAPLIARGDDRQPPDRFEDAAFADEARGFVAALVFSDVVTQDPGGAPVLASVPLFRDHADQAGVELCRDERFALEPTAAFCSATLIAEDLVLTAGHCVVSQAECAETSIVFGYEADVSSAVQPLEAADIYGCSELVVGNRGLGDEPDFAVLRLDRPALDREPARIARDVRSLPLGLPILIAGHPMGLPLKITGDGSVAPLPAGYPGQEPDYFGADIDTFPGNSGSGAYFAAQGAPRALVGILSASLTQARYRYDAQRDCDRYERWPNVTIWLAYAHRALSALCAEVSAGSYPELCGCGDGECAAYEDGTVCAHDCGDACGDAVCAEDESPASCRADCPVCGDGTCGLGEPCCADCGCAEGFECQSGACTPDLEAAAADGFTCDDAITLPAVSAELEGSTIGALRRHICEADDEGACYGPERHYAFTLAVPASLTAVASGFAHVALVLRRGACDPGPPFEVAIDRAGAGISRLSRVLPAGEYQLVVEGERSYDHGDYRLDLDFRDPPVRDGDDCADAIELPGSGAYTVSGDTSPAANDEGYGAGAACSASSFGNDHYYRFTLTARTRLSATMSAGFDAALVLSEGACAPGTLRCAAEPAALTRVLNPGTYTLRVDGQVHFDAGPYTLALDFLPNPPALGESCEDAIELSPSGQQRIAGTVLGAQDDADTPCDTGTSGDRVYVFTLTEPRTVRVEGTGSPGVRVDISAACPYTSGQTCLPLAASPRSFSQTLDPGSYFVVIDARTAGIGAYDLELDFESEPLGESCIDAIPLALSEAPLTVTRTGVPLSNVTAIHYRVALAAPSELTLSASDPGALRVFDGTRTITRPTGELSMNTAAGSYCVQVNAPLGTPELGLTASAAPLAEPDGRGCVDAIELSAPGNHDLSGYVALGGSVPTHCTSDAHHFYAFELTEPTRLRATVTEGFGLGVYDHPECSELAYCSAGRTLNELLEPGAYRLFVAGYSLAPYELSLELDCDPDDDGVCSASDGCPSSPGKTAPGQCGCWTPDTDGDGDGVADCVDPCPSVAGASAPCATEPTDAAVSEVDAGLVLPDDDAGSEPEPEPDATVLEPPSEDAAVAADAALPRDDGSVVDLGDPTDAGIAVRDGGDDADAETDTRRARYGCDCQAVGPRAQAHRAWLSFAMVVAAIATRLRRKLRAVSSA